MIAYMAGNRVAANLLMVFILAGGLLSVGSIDQEVLPEYSLNRIQVSVPYPGASPEEMEEAVVRRVEERVRSVEGVGSVESVAAEGRATVVAELVRGTNAERSLNDIKAAIDGIQSLPTGAERPQVTEMTSRLSVMRVALYGDVPERTLKELAHRTADEIAALPEVSQVRTTGVRDYEISIEVPASHLTALGLTLADVATVVRDGALELSAGSLDTRYERVRIRTTGRSVDQYDFEDIIVRAHADGTVVRLGDIAEVRDEFAEGEVLSRYNGQLAAFVEVYRTTDERVLDISKAVNQYLTDSAAPRLPRGVRVDVWSNEAEGFATALSLMLRNALLGLLLVLAGLTLFLELRLAFWVAAGIVVSFVGTLGAMAALDASINLVSLFAFILVMGIVVDDAVVVGENIATERDHGSDGLAGTIRGTRRVASPVIFGVLTTVAAFCPLLFVPGSLGTIAGTIPMIVIATLLFSLVESLLVLPHHLTTSSAPVAGGANRRSRGGLHARLRARVRRGMERFVNGPLDRALHFATARPWVTVAMGVGALIGCIGMIPAGVVGVAFTPYVEGDFVTARLEMPEGTPRARTASAAQRLGDAGRRAVDRLSGGRPEGAEPLLTGVAITLGGTLTGVGSASGAPESGARAHTAEVQLRLLDEERRNISASVFEQAWREEADRIDEPWDLEITANLVDLGRPLHVELAHPDAVRLAAIADTLSEHLRASPGIFNVRSDMDRGVREIQVDPKPEARTLGFTVDELARQVRAAFFGEEAQRVQRDREELRVYVRLPGHERNSVADLETYRLRTPEGSVVHLDQVADLRFGASPLAVRRKDGTRVATVTAEVDATTLTSQAASQRLDALLRELSSRHSDFAYSFGGENREMAEALSALGRGMILALLAIYALLAIPFGSYLRPLVVMAAMPFGLVGVVLGHLLMGFDIAATSVFGVVGLCGVVVNDSIVMIDVIEERRRAGTPAREAIISGAKARFRPIFLTSFTTFLGLAPLVLEQSLQARFLTPMAASLGFGILSATAVLMLIVPALTALQIGGDPRRPVAARRTPA